MSGEQINSGLWSTDTSDTCDFNLCGTIKQKFYRLDPHTIEELKENMRRLLFLQTKCQCMKVDFSWMCQEFV